MNIEEYQKIKKSVCYWAENIIKIYPDILENINNEADKLICNFTFTYCLAQVVVCTPIFAPYRYVEFEALTFDSKKAVECARPDLIYFFYDSEKDTEETITLQLNQGIEYCLNYSPDYLEKKYDGKKGKLNLIDSQIGKYLHTDDLKKYNKNIGDMDFMCMGTHAQYLVVKNDKITLRVLEEGFQLI